jgi:hypothetical protein
MSGFSGTGRLRSGLGSVGNFEAVGGQIVQGREYLAYFWNRLAAGTASKIVVTGDSRVLGQNQTTPYIITNLLARSAQRRGYAGVTTVNRGQSAKATFDWIAQTGADYLTNDLAQSPDLLAIAFGYNDAFYGRTVAQCLADMEAGLARIRTLRNQSQLSLVLCVPYSSNDRANGRDQKYIEQLRYGYINLARKYFCTLIDQYSYLADSEVTVGGASTLGLLHDDPLGTGAHVHHNDFGGVHNGTLIADAIFPDIRQLPINYTRTWISATLQNGWADYDNSIFHGASYSIDALGMVRLRGEIKNGARAVGTIILNLPTGFRPAKYKSFTCNADLGVAGGAAGGLQLQPSGNLTVDYLPAGGSYLSLDNVAFDLAP